MWLNSFSIVRQSGDFILGGHFVRSVVLSGLYETHAEYDKAIKSNGEGSGDNWLTWTQTCNQVTLFWCIPCRDDWGERGGGYAPALKSLPVGMQCILFLIEVLTVTLETSSLDAKPFAGIGRSPIKIHDPIWVPWVTRYVNSFIISHISNETANYRFAFRVYWMSEPNAEMTKGNLRKQIKRVKKKRNLDSN